jgi:hypothetical protein
LNTIELKVLYFDREYFIEYYNKWKYGANFHISPLEQSWNYFFKPKVIESKILDRFQFKTVSDKVLNIHSIYVLEDDFLWLECIPSYESGKFVNINTTNLFSISSLREASVTYKTTFKDKYRNNFGEDWMLDQLFTVLNRKNRLKEIGI